MIYKEYYSARVNLGALAAGVLSGLLYAILALASLLFGVFGPLDWTRISISVFMIATATVVYLLAEKRPREISLVIDVFSFIYLLSVPLFVIWARAFGVDLRFGFTVSMAIGLTLHYAVLRLSASKSIAIGGGASVVAHYLVYEGFDLESVRSAVYLAVTNLTGFILCFVLEKRERAMLGSRLEVNKVWNRVNALRNDFSQERRDEKAWVAAIAHELSQPLLATRYYLDNIVSSHKPRSEVIHSELSTSINLARKSLAEVELGFTRIVNQIRLSSEVTLVRMSWVTLRALIDDAIEAVGIQDRELLKFVEVVVVNDGDVYTDRFLLARVLRNMIENALSNSPGPASRVRIKVGLREPCGGINITVLNILGGGLFLSSDKVSYTRFRRPVGKGLGVGLAIVKNFIAALPGHDFSLKVKRGVGARANLHINSPFTRDVFEGVVIKQAVTFSETRFFLDSDSLRFIISSIYLEKCLSIELAEVDYIGSSLKNSNEREVARTFVIEVIPRFLSAESYFGRDIYQLMVDSGRYIFLSHGSIDDSFHKLGVVVDVSGGVAKVRSTLDNYLFV